MSLLILIQGLVLKNSFISAVFNSITVILGAGLLVCVTVLPFVYGYVIYNRFTRTGEHVNQQLMKRHCYIMESMPGLLDRPCTIILMQ